MPRVTRLKTQKSQKRVNVYLDGNFAFGLNVDSVVKFGLKVGQVLTEKQVKKLKNQNDEEKVFQKALKFFSYRPRSEKELIDYLKKKRTSSGLIDKTIQKLKKLKLINDQEFAVWWLEQRSTFRPRGKRALRAELFKKGIDREIIETVLEKTVDELKLAQKAAGKKLKTLSKLPPDQFQEKMTGFLARNGFSWETIKATLDQISKKR
jgi:regulatory protein